MEFETHLKAAATIIKLHGDEIGDSDYFKQRLVW